MQSLLSLWEPGGWNVDVRQFKCERSVAMATFALRVRFCFLTPSLPRCQSLHHAHKQCKSQHVSLYPDDVTTPNYARFRGLTLQITSTSMEKTGPALRPPQDNFTLSTIKVFDVNVLLPGRMSSYEIYIWILSSPIISDILVCRHEMFAHINNVKINIVVPTYHADYAVQGSSVKHRCFITSSTFPLHPPSS